MSRFTTNTLAALVAVIITATSLVAITDVPGQPHLALITAPALA
jgi:uridylate kinase